MTIKERNYPFDIGLSRIIQQKGIKQTYVAQKAGYSPQELSEMINGRRLIKVCDVPRLAKALGVSSEDVYAAGESGDGDRKEVV